MAPMDQAQWIEGYRYELGIRGDCRDHPQEDGYDVYDGRSAENVTVSLDVMGYE